MVAKKGHTKVVRMVVPRVAHLVDNLAVQSVELMVATMADNLVEQTVAWWVDMLVAKLAVK